MDSITNQKPSATPLVSSDERGLRAQRTWLLVNVMFLTWAFYAAFLWLRGCEAAARVCSVQDLVYLMTQGFLRKTNKYKTIIHSLMTASAVGLFLVALSDPRLSATV